MVALKWLLLIAGIGLFGSAGALVAYDVYISSQLRRLLRRSRELASGEAGATSFLELKPLAARSLRAEQLGGLAAVMLLVSQSLVVVPDGFAGERVSQFWGVRPGTLYPGLHLVTPPIESVAPYHTREPIHLSPAGTANVSARMDRFA